MKMKIFLQLSISVEMIVNIYVWNWTQREGKKKSFNWISEFEEVVEMNENFNVKWATKPPTIFQPRVASLEEIVYIKISKEKSRVKSCDRMHFISSGILTFLVFVFINISHRVSWTIENYTHGTNAESQLMQISFFNFLDCCKRDFKDSPSINGKLCCAHNKQIYEFLQLLMLSFVLSRCEFIILIPARNSLFCFHHASM